MKLHNLLLTIAALAALTGCANPMHQMAVDTKVDELCAKEGKAIVYEKEAIPFSSAKIALSKKYVKLGDTHFWEHRSTRVEGTRSGDVPDITRRNAKLYRASDGLLLGEYTYFWRTGGDFLPAHPSTYGCNTTLSRDLMNKIFATYGGE